MIDMCLCSHCARIFPQKELREYSMPMLHSTLPSRDRMADKSKDILTDGRRIELGKINVETLTSVEEEALNKIPASNLSLSPTLGILSCETTITRLLTGAKLTHIHFWVGEYFGQKAVDFGHCPS